MQAVYLLRHNLHFDKDVKVHLFEVVIRVLGGLLSAHLLITRDPNLLPSYNGILLDKARDLADRMLPAFQTPSGLPALFVNLKTGQVNDTNVTCTACAGTLLLEFGQLSTLTKDPKYMQHAHRCARTIHGKRSKLGLVGSYLDINSHEWTSREATIGPGIDSYYEYLLKAFLMFGEQSYLDMFLDIYSSSMFHMQLPTSVRALSFLADVNIDSGRVTNPWLSSLGAFWPGMQSLIGQEREAVELHSNYTHAWKTFGWMPEAFSLDLTRVNSADPGYNLRPEHIESTYMLHSITGRDEYLEIGRSMLETLEKHNRVECGYASITDVTTGQHQDLQESFFLSETLKYFYLLYSNSTDFIDHFVLTTEGHIMPILHSPPEGVNYGDPDDEYEDFRDENESIPTPDPSSIPPNCNQICSQISPVEQKTRVSDLQKSFPLLHFDIDESTLLRRRRCHACIEVTAKMKDQPSLTEEERTKMMKLPLDQNTGVFKSAPILAQVVCVVVRAQRSNSATCSILRPLTPHDNQFGKIDLQGETRIAQSYDDLSPLSSGVPANSVIFNLILSDATEEEIAAAKTLKESALKAAVKAQSRWRPLVIAVGGLGDQTSLCLFGRPAEFGPAQNTAYEPCLDHILEEGSSSLSEAEKSSEPAAPGLLFDSQMCPMDKLLPSQNLSHDSCSWLDVSSTHSRACEKSLWEADASQKELETSRGCLDATSVVGKLVLADPIDGCSAQAQLLGQERKLKGSIAVVYRGNCSFMQKAFSMQEMGALGVIVVNRPGLGPDGDGLGSMGADGTNRNILIPSALLSKSDGERLVQAIALSSISPRPLLSVLTLEPVRVKRLSKPPPGVSAILNGSSEEEVSGDAESNEVKPKQSGAPDAKFDQVVGPEVKVEFKVPRIEMVVPLASNPFIQGQFVSKNIDLNALLHMLLHDGKVQGLLMTLGQASLATRKLQVVEVSSNETKT